MEKTQKNKSFPQKSMYIPHGFQKKKTKTKRFNVYLKS